MTYTVAVFTGEITIDATGVSFMPDDNDPNFQTYEAWLLEGNTPTQIFGETVAAAQTRLCWELDAFAMETSGIIVPSPGKLQEYVQAYADAQTFNATGVASTYISVWAQINGWTNAQAVAEIMEEGTLFTESLADIRNIRLTGKAQINAYTGTSIDALETIYASYQEQLQAVQAALLPYSI